MDYKTAFETLVRQIKQETEWSKELYKRDYPEGLNIPTKKETKNCSDTQFWREMGVYGHERYDKGMMCAYGSIERVAKRLEESLKENNNDGSSDQTDYEYEHDVVCDMFV